MKPLAPKLAFVFDTGGTSAVLTDYKIKTTFKAVDEDENKSRRDAVSRVVAKAMKRLQDRKKIQ
jgi:hypothetical protein